MKLLVSGLAAAVLCLSAASVQAASAPPAATIPQDQTAEAAAMQEWLAATMRWAQGYDALTTQMIDTLTWLLDGAEEVVVKVQTGGPAVAKPWADGWAAEARARLEVDMAAYTALPTEAPPFPRNVRIPPEVQTRMEMVGQTPDQVGRMVLRQRHASEEYIAVIQSTAAAKKEDFAPLESARMGLMIAQLEAEITMLQSASTGLTGPNLHLARSQMTTNRAIIAWLEHNRLLFMGRAPDTPAAAAAIRVQAVEGRREVEAVRGSIIDLRQRFREEPSFADTPLGGLLLAALVTLERSADVEERMAGTLDELADALLSGDEAADDEIGIKLETLTNERIAIDAARRQMIAQGGG